MALARAVCGDAGWTLTDGNALSSCVTPPWSWTRASSLPSLREPVPEMKPCGARSHRSSYTKDMQSTSFKHPHLRWLPRPLRRTSRTAPLKFLDGSAAYCPITALLTRWEAAGWEKSIEPFAPMEPTKSWWPSSLSKVASARTISSRASGTSGKSWPALTIRTSRNSLTEAQPRKAFPML